MNLPDWLPTEMPLPEARCEQAAITRQSQLTKPPGSLGELEKIAIRMAGLQATERPKVSRIQISIFAADHGVAIEGVSAFPQSVTAQMIENFGSGGAAISVLAQELGAQLDVVNLGTVGPVGRQGRFHDARIAAGTENLVSGPAMTAEQCLRALRVGHDVADRAKSSGIELFIGGEMGIANTTAATAMACALLRLPASRLVGTGTGVDAAGLERKTRVIERALALHAARCIAPLEALRRLGGFEIAALVGAYLSAGARRLPVLVDGFITSVAALCAVRIAPGLLPWLVFAHHSAEPGHAIILDALSAKPLLQLGMRLGEGSGAASAVPLIRAACALHAGMATFAEAGVASGAS